MSLLNQVKVRVKPLKGIATLCDVLFAVCVNLHSDDRCFDLNGVCCGRPLTLNKYFTRLYDVRQLPKQWRYDLIIQHAVINSRNCEDV